MAFAELHKRSAHHLKTAHHSTSKDKFTGATDLCEQDAASLRCSLKKLEESNSDLKKQIEGIVSSNNELKDRLARQENILTDVDQSMKGRLEKPDGNAPSPSGVNMPTVLGILGLVYFLFRSRYAGLANLASIVNVERSIGEGNDDTGPGLFKFHGIDKVDLDNANIKPKHLAYLVSNFTAGRIYDQGRLLPGFVKWPKWSVFSFGKRHYRYKMLENINDETWGLIKKMMIEDRYITALDKTRDDIKRK
jgi:hypothetical protein